MRMPSCTAGCSQSANRNIYSACAIVNLPIATAVSRIEVSRTELSLTSSSLIECASRINNNIEIILLAISVMQILLC